MKKSHRKAMHNKYHPIESENLLDLSVLKDGLKVLEKLNVVQVASLAAAGYVLWKKRDAILDLMNARGISVPSWLEDQHGPAIA